MKIIQLSYVGIVSKNKRIEEKNMESSDVIYTYTTKQAVEDGVMVLMDEELSKEAGLKYPVVVTTNLFETWIEPNKEDELDGQSITGRLWDLYTIFKIEARRTKDSFLTISLDFWTQGETKNVKLYAVCQAYDETGQACITFMLPEDY